MKNKLVSRCCGAEVKKLHIPIMKNGGYRCLKCYECCEVIPQPIQKEEVKQTCSAHFKGIDGLGTCNKECQWFREGSICPNSKEAIIPSLQKEKDEYTFREENNLHQDLDNETTRELMKDPTPSKKEEVKKVYILKKDCPNIGKEIGDYYNGEYAERVEELLRRGIIEEEVQEDVKPLEYLFGDPIGQIENIMTDMFGEEGKEAVKEVFKTPTPSDTFIEDFLSNFPTKEQVLESFKKDGSDTWNFTPYFINKLKSSLQSQRQSILEEIEKKINERIKHIETLGKGLGINDRRIHELKWVIKQLVKTTKH